MDMRFRLLTILKTINTKPMSSKERTAVSKTTGAMLLSSALVFLLFGIYGFWCLESRDGWLFLGLTLLCAVGALFHRRLFRREAIAAAFGIALALAVIYGTLQCFNGVGLALWALFFPMLTICVCGIKFGILISSALVLYFPILFYTPLWKLAPGEYPPQLRYSYPVLYAAACVVMGVYGYLRHKQLLNRQQYEQTMEKAVKTEREHLMIMSTQVILSISNAVDARDAYTQRHSARVAEYSVLLAKALGWDSKRLDQLYSIALLHDIGKIGISDSILNKHSALTPEEREIIKQHTVIGGEILKDLTLLPNASIGAVSHHERYDGTGYPYGLKGKQIPIEARIIGIADSFDAMNSSRVYRARSTPKKIMQELQNGRGSQFDPQLLDSFLPIAEQILQQDEG